MVDNNKQDSEGEYKQWYQQDPVKASAKSKRKGKKLSMALEKRDWETANRLIDEGENVNFINRVGTSNLEFAASGGNFEIFMKMVNKGAIFLPEGSNSNKVTHHAARGGNVDIMRFLVDSGLDPHMLTMCEGSLMHHAVQSGNIEMIDYLLEIGIPFDTKDYYGQTPMYLAVCFGNVQLIEKFMGLGCDIFAIFRHDENLLKVAVAYEKPEAVKFLLDKGLDPFAKDQYGRSAYDTAKMRGNVEIQKMFEDLQRSQER